MPPLPTAVQAGYYYDSDGDGFDDTYVPDPWEDPAYYGYSTPPSDQDGDGWEDALDPFPADARLNPQTDPDADGVPSELEWFYGMNDLDPADGAADLDGDGFSNAEAFQQGWVLDAALVSPVPDLDGDRLNDITEAHWALAHPGSLDPGNPLDPVADYDQDGVMNFEELTWGLDLASPTSPATGEDLAFMQLVTGDYGAFVTPGYPGYSATDPDGDGLPSLLEYQLQLDPRSADSDEDGVPDGEEDTDGDGFGNLAEVAAGTLPGQAASHPEASPAGGTGGDGSGSTSGTGNEQGNGNGATGSAVPPVGGTALAATTDLHLRVRSLKVSGGTITRHSQEEWIYTSGSGTSSEEMAAMKADGWDLSDSFTMDIPTGTDPDGLPTGYETWYWWNAKKQVGVAGETILPFSCPSGELASDQAVSEAYADEPGQVYQEDVSGELNLNNPASGDVFAGWEEGGGVSVVSEFAASKQSTPVSDTGLYPQGEAAEVWVEGSAPEVAQRKTYLILGSSTMFQWAPVWQGAGTVTFLLEPGMTGVGRVEALTGAPPWVTVHNGRLWVEPPVEQGMTNVVRLIPIEVKVDYDRDGEDDILGDSGDNVPPGKRYRFWTNIDNDEGDDAEAEDQLINYQVFPNIASDSTDNTIDCLRDLEDFTRLSLDLSGLANLSNFEIGLKFVDVADPISPPSIRVFLSADEEDGTDDYLFQMDAANAQVNGQSIHSSGLVTVTNQSAWFPDGTLDHASSTKRLHMIFEGVTPGRGTLAVEIKTPDGGISTIPFIPMEIKPVRDMYEHWTALDTEEVNIEDIPATATKAADSGTFDPEGPEADDAIVFVHGWRMKLRDRRDYADTSYKRLWHAGFAGKFYNFSWPTEYTDRVDWLPGDPPADLANYAKSEEKAYVSGRGALKDFLTSKIQVQPSKTRIFSHSMGGIVVSEALLAGATVHTFASCQSAMAAHAYGRPASGAVDRALPPFVNWETDEVYANYPPTGAPYYDSIRSVIYNFYNEDDSALDSWKYGQTLKPNDGEGGSPSEHYFYDKPATQYFFENDTTFRALNFPDNAHEIFAHAAEAQSYALGALSHPSISRNFNLNDDFTAPEMRFGADHSAQFRGTNMIRYPFWRQLIGPACFASSHTRTNP